LLYGEDALKEKINNKVAISAIFKYADQHYEEISDLFSEK